MAAQGFAPTPLESCLVRRADTLHNSTPSIVNTIFANSAPLLRPTKLPEEPTTVFLTFLAYHTLQQLYPFCETSDRRTITKIFLFTPKFFIFQKLHFLKPYICFSRFYTPIYFSLQSPSQASD